jgi:hypothetical protein
MKNLFFALLSIVSINLYSNPKPTSNTTSNSDSELELESRTVVNAWECNDIIVTLYTNGTCDVGELTYNVTYSHMDLMTFSYAGKKFLVAIFADNDNTLIIRNSDDKTDMKYFIKCT